VTTARADVLVERHARILTGSRVGTTASARLIGRAHGDVPDACLPEARAISIRLARRKARGRGRVSRRRVARRRAVLSTERASSAFQDGKKRPARGTRRAGDFVSQACLASLRGFRAAEAFERGVPRGPGIPNEFPLRVFPESSHRHLEL
jgi:hypothetical protein